MRTSGIALLVVLLIGCGKKEVSFRTDIQPMLNNRCVQCHGAEKPAGKVMLTTYESLVSSTVSRWKKPVVIPGNPGDSWLYLRTGTTQPHFRMPPDTLTVVPLTDKEIELIGRWIQQGAKNN
jgi:uncharacterized membrane protein